MEHQQGQYRTTQKRRWWIGAGVMGVLIIGYGLLVLLPDPYLIRTIGTTAAVTELIFSPDGHILASGDAEGRVQFWDSTTGTLLRTIVGHRGPIRGIAFTPQGDMLASAGEDGHVQLWDVASGELRRVITQTQPRDGPIQLESGAVLDANVPWYSLCFSPDGRTIAVGREGQIVVLDVATGHIQHQFEGHRLLGSPEIVVALAFSADGRWLASGGFDGTAYLWDREHGKVAHRLSTAGTSLLEKIQGLQFRADQGALYTVHSTSQVDVWSIPDGRLVQSYNSPQHPITALQFRGEAQVSSVAFSSDGQLVAIGGGTRGDDFRGIPLLGKKNDPRIIVWKVGDVAARSILTGHRDNVLALAFHPDDKMLASGSADYTIRFWQLP